MQNFEAKSRLNDLHKSLTSKEREGQKVNLAKIDCSSMLHQMNREIKSLNYKLMRVINTQEVHTQLLPGKVNDIECLENTPILFKVEVKG